MTQETQEAVVDKKPTTRYTEDELMARLKFTVGICLAVTLMGIVFVVLYSIIFVTQPLNAISPVDSKFFELIIPIATFLTGTLSGIMLAGNNKDAQMKALEAATAKPTPSPTVPKTDYGFGNTSGFGGGFGSMSNTGFGMSNNFGPSRVEPSFGGSTMTSPSGIVSHNGKLGPAQEPHPVI